MPIYESKYRSAHGSIMVAQLKKFGLVEHWSRTFQKTIGPVIGRVRNPTIVVGKIVKTPMAAPSHIPVAVVLA